MLVAEQRLPDTRLPIVVEAVGVCRVLGFTPGGILDVEVDGRRDAVTPEAELALPALPLHVVGPREQLIQVLDAERDVQEFRLLGLGPENIVVIGTAVRPQKYAAPARHVRDPKLQPVLVERGRLLDVRESEHHMMDQLGLGPTEPFAVLVPAHGAAGCVDQLLLGGQRLARKDPKTDRQARIVVAIDGAVVVPHDGAIPAQIGLQGVDAGLAIDAPDDAPDAGSLCERCGQGRVIRRAQQDVRAFRQSVIDLGRALARGDKSEIVEEPLAAREIGHAEYRRFHTQDRHCCLLKQARGLAPARDG